MMNKYLALLLAFACGFAHAQGNTNPQTNYSSQMLSANPSVYLTFNNPAQPLRENQTGVLFTPSSAGTILTNQVGFDNTQPNNTAASFTYNAYAVAPNKTLGSFEWSQPFSIVYQIDRLNWGRTGTKMLLSKGNLYGGANYQLYLTMAAANIANFCFETVTKGGIAAPNQVAQTTCTPINMDMANGMNYSIAAGNDGTGQPNSTGNWLTVNGVNGTSLVTRYINAGGSYANGGVVITVGGSGTGYANSTPFNGVGGGTNCTVFGTLNAASGVPSTITISYTHNYGCTSLPTITLAPYNVTLSGSGTGYATSTAFTSSGGGTGCVIAGTMTSASGVPSSVTITTDTNACTSAPTLTLTSPTGTGETITATATTGTGVTLTPAAFGASLVNTSLPLYILGDYYNTGPVASDTNSAEAPTVIDEMAIFPSLLTTSQIDSIFYQTKFYQNFLKAIPSTPYRLIFDNDGTADPDDIYALSMTIAAQRLGYIQLAAASSTTSDSTAAAMYRQMLDQAGLAHIPVCVPSSFASAVGTSVAASITAYNASTPQGASNYPQCSSVYRKIMAANPTSPVFIMLAGSFRSVADWLGSAADSIEGLTGLQQAARNATNGGAIYAQGLGMPPQTVTGDNSLQDWTAGQYVAANNGSMPIYWFAGSPQPTGPGPLYTRNSKDPLYLFANHLGTDSRNGYDSLPTMSFISGAFSFPVTITINAGGSGYATTQAFTSTGGGPNCNVSGTITSVSGVLTTVNYLNTAYPTYFGIGNGCTSAPSIVLTAPTGTGASLTAVPVFACGTYTITGAGAGSVTASCGSNVHYFVNPSYYTSSGALPVMTWFANSLNDPPPNGSPRVR